MRTNVDNLAEDYALEKHPEYLLELSDSTFDDSNEEIYKECKESFKAGFEKCFELGKPLFKRAIEDFKSEYGDNEDYKYTYEKIEKFLEKYKGD